MIDDVVRLQEEPFGSTSVFMQYFVFKKAKEVGCKVMLDGQGGDETLLGYERYYSAALASETGLRRWRLYFDIVKNSKLSFLDLMKYSIYFRYASNCKVL